jgi:site-specific DNA-methyltransferase (adenine-specific)
VIDLKHPVTLMHGAVEDALQLIPDNSVSAVLTDPPYNLAMGGGTEGWDAIKNFPQWCELWGSEALRVTKPGGWIIAFGSGKTWHDLATGLDKAGWDILDSIIWHYPSGFMRGVDIPARLAAAGSPERAAQMRGRGTALHSRHEPAIFARAPLKGGLVSTVAEHSTATLGLDDCRLPNGSDPPNVLVSHSPFCGGTEDGLECVEGCPVPWMGANLEYFPTFRFEGKPSKDERPRVQVEAGEGTKRLTTLGQIRAWKCSVCGVITQSYMKSGSKYSNRPHPVCSHDSYEPLTENFSSVIAHNTVKPLGLMRWLVRLLTLPGDRVLEPFSGSGSTVEACVLEGREVVAVERDLSSIELTRVRLRRQGCYVSE